MAAMNNLGSKEGVYIPFAAIVSLATITYA